jgi:hypothetical protein
MQELREQRTVHRGDEVEDRVFFARVMKTGGDGLFRMFRRAFGPDAVYPRPDDASDMVVLGFSVDLLLERWRASDDIRVVAGHFPLCTIELLGSRFTTITVLRDPVERTLSLLRHLRQRNFRDVDLPLEELYSHPERFPFRDETKHLVLPTLLHNHMVKMFSLATTEMTDGILTNVPSTPERLETAKRALTTIDVLGFQESYDSFCADLYARFGWGADRPKRRINDTEPCEASDELRAQIAEDNADDIALYEHALTLRQPDRSLV